MRGQTLAAAAALIIMYSMAGSGTVPAQAQTRGLTAGTPQILAGGFTWAEGPAEARDGTVYFTDNRENCLWALTPGRRVTLVSADAHRVNGLYPAGDGTIYACAGDPASLMRFDPSTGAMTVICDSADGAPLNAPNDCWADARGGVYFTDPYWGRGENRSRVYYLPAGADEPVPVIDTMTRPNGVAGSPDGRVLYVTDWDDKVTFAFDIGPGGALTGKRLFAETGDDGMTVDEHGNVYLTGETLTVVNPAGETLETIAFPETPANCIFGGGDGRTLIVTARTGVYAITMNVQGARQRGRQ